MTKYVVFKKNDKGWGEFGQASAAGRRAAIQAVLKIEGGEGEFVAVPVRSWQPVKVQVEQALKFS